MRGSKRLEVYLARAASENLPSSKSMADRAGRPANTQSRGEIWLPEYGPSGSRNDGWASHYSRLFGLDLACLDRAMALCFNDTQRRHYAAAICTLLAILAM
jgi:hypothetical protein